MSASAPPGSTWDEVSGTASGEVVRRFESAWRDGSPSKRPDPIAYAEGASPALTLSLLRADLALRWEGGEHAEASRYRSLGLSEEAMVALAYEEFCLREEYGESPRPAQFYERYAEIARPLRRVLDIHDLVGSGHAASTASLGMGRGTSTVPFPEVGQTIGGFHLVEELGRGGFARVFLAKERQLGDRPVALKVSRTGSREPQTLARLQHTHIVPVHSYRTDPATGLHLLCMPYFGRVTLAHVLADPAVKDAIHGAELITALDRLDGEGASGTSVRTAGRTALTGRSYARAMAWWGARLAEALQHAHDRGVLHRDVKPSNVLVTADGMPMLLDFNLAHEPFDPEKDDTPSALGGTVAYMSPEHLDALADGSSDGGDGRSDIYALGVVLFEAMGERPFGPPPSSRSVTEALRRAAEIRRTAVPRLRERFPEVPTSLDAVVSRCLAPNPADRYNCALDLAEDLQAVADDLPLSHAREPMLVRIAVKVRRHRRAMIATAAVLGALGVAAFYSFAARVAGDQQRVQALYAFERGVTAEEAGNYKEASDHFFTAENLATGASKLESFRLKARSRALSAAGAAQTSQQVAAFQEQADGIRLALLGLDHANPSEVPAPPSLEDALQPFFVRRNEDWVERDEMHAIAPRTRTELARNVHQLLFLAAVKRASSPERSKVSEAIALCDNMDMIRRMRIDSKAIVPEESLEEAPWDALRSIAEARYRGHPHPAVAIPPLSSRMSAWECTAWGHILLLDPSPRSKGQAVAWLVEAAHREPSRFANELDVATVADRAGLDDIAYEHYSTAIDLVSRSPRARLGRGRILRSRGAWARARNDLNEAKNLIEARLELGLVDQAVGDFQAARAEYQAIIADGNPAFRHAAILNLAKLDADSGNPRAAATAIEGILQADGNDEAARQARAVLSLRFGDPEKAVADLDVLLAKTPENAERLGLRALARLALDRPDLARFDAEKAVKIDPSPRRERVFARANLAIGRFNALKFDDPDEVRALPKAGGKLGRDLRVAAEFLGRPGASPTERSCRAVIICALDDVGGAELEATRAINAAPLSPRTWLVRARIRRDRGDQAGALSDVNAGLSIDPEDPRLVGLLGRLKVDSGDPTGALSLLERAARRTGGSPLDRPRAEARTRLGQGRAAAEEWKRVIEHDPDDPTAYLGQARAFLQAGKVDEAMADLERAIGLAEGRPDVLWGITRAYAQCVRRHPDRLRRVTSLAFYSLDALK